MNCHSGQLCCPKSGATKRSANLCVALGNQTKKAANEELGVKDLCLEICVGAGHVLDKEKEGGDTDNDNACSITGGHSLMWVLTC